MTRFARARGSKSSNEKRPEDATSWQEMRDAMLQNKTTNTLVKVESSYKPIVDSVEPPVQWVSLDNPKKVKKSKKTDINGKSHEPTFDKMNESKAKLQDAVDSLVKLIPFDNLKKEIKINKLKKTSGKCMGSKNPKGEKNNTQENSAKKRKNLETNDQPTMKKIKHETASSQRVLENSSANDVKTDLLDNVKLKKKKKSVKLIKGNVLDEKISEVFLGVHDTKYKPNRKISKKLIKQKKEMKKKTEGAAIDKNKTPSMKKLKQSIISDHCNNNNENPGTKLYKTKIFVNKTRKVNEKRTFDEKRKYYSQINQSYQSLSQDMTISVNGETVRLLTFDGFYVTEEDAKRLKQLRRDMKQKGLPRKDVETAIKLERRRAEKHLARLRKKVCFHCRDPGHNLSDCPEMNQKSAMSGICYKCGSTEHTYFDCKVTHKQEFRFAECFICKEQGHIAKQCPDNPRGLYPKGGACNVCGDVTHLKKDCPNFKSQKEQQHSVSVGVVRKSMGVEDLDEDTNTQKVIQKSSKNSKIVKF